MIKTLKIGSRKSKLALAQSLEIKETIEKKSKLRCEIITFETQGDLNLSSSLEALVQKEAGIEQKGLFTKELESSLLSGQIDLAVHSLKDLPTVIRKDLLTLAISKREAANDVLVCASKHQEKKLDSLIDLPEKSKFGTSSPRRIAQLKLIRPDLKFQLLRGNIETRIKKIKESKNNLDAGILAYAGLKRRALQDQISQILSFEESVPAPGQGALAIQTSLSFYRENQALYCKLFKFLNDQETRFLVNLERDLLNFTEAGCSSPFGAYASFLDDQRASIKLRVFWERKSSYFKKNYLIRIKNFKRDLEKIKRELEIEKNA